MTYQLSPSVLARTKERFFVLRRQAVALTPRIHIDIMDGHFAPTKSIGANILQQAKLTRSVAVHLMVFDPRPWISVVALSGARRVIIHIESRNAVAAVQEAKKLDLEIGLAVKNLTNISRLRSFSNIRWIHVMDGTIGRYGAKFDHRAIKQIKHARRVYPRAYISCDIGLNPATIPLVVAAGAKEVVVGSYLWKSKSPSQRWAMLKAEQRIL